jgi:hypothetical protein
MPLLKQFPHKFLIEFDFRMLDFPCLATGYLDFFFTLLVFHENQSILHRFNVSRQKAKTWGKVKHCIKFFIID